MVNWSDCVFPIVQIKFNYMGKFGLSWIANQFNFDVQGRMYSWDPTDPHFTALTTENSLSLEDVQSQSFLVFSVDVKYQITAWERWKISNFNRLYS